MRLGRFIAHDARIVGGVAARFFDELTKRTAGGGRSLAVAARERASATTITGESEQSVQQPRRRSTDLPASLPANQLPEAPHPALQTTRDLPE